MRSDDIIAPPPGVATSLQFGLKGLVAALVRKGKKLRCNSSTSDFAYFDTNSSNKGIIEFDSLLTVKVFSKSCYIFFEGCVHLTHYKCLICIVFLFQINFHFEISIMCINYFSINTRLFTH